jgi:WD40 repeat protein
MGKTTKPSQSSRSRPVRRQYLCLMVLIAWLSVIRATVSAQSNHERPPITSQNAANVVLLSTAGSEPIADIVWSPDGYTLAVSTASQVRLLDATDLTRPGTILRDPAWGQTQYYHTGYTASGGGDLAYTPDGDTLIVGHSPRLDFWDVRTNALQGVYVSGDLGMDRFVYDAEQDMLIVGGNNVNTMTWGFDNITGVTETGQVIDLSDYRWDPSHYAFQRGSYVSDIALSPDHQSVAISSAYVGSIGSAYANPYGFTHPGSPDIQVWSIQRVRFWQAAYKYFMDVQWWEGPPPDFTLHGHTQPVRQIVYSPDGSLLASASLDGTVRLWSMPDGESHAVLRDPLMLAVWDVDFSPDGLQVVTASADGTLRLWDVETSSLLQTLRGTGVALTLVAFSSDGARLAAAGKDGSLWMFDAQTGEQLSARPSQQPMWSVAFSPDGQTIATGNGDNNVVVWEVPLAEPTATIRQTLHGHLGPVYDVVYSPDGTLLASASSDHTVRLWNTRSGEEIAVLEGHTASVYGVAFSPDGTLLASGSWDRTARLWDVTSHETSEVLTSPREVFSVAFSPDGRLLAYGDTHLWDVANRREIAYWDTFHGWSDTYAPPIGKLVFSEDGQTLINGGYIYGSAAWDIATLERKPTPASPVIAVHDNLLAIEALGLFDLTTEQWLTEPSGVDPRHSIHLTRDVTFSPDGTLIVTVGTDGAMQFWGVAEAAHSATAGE